VTDLIKTLIDIYGKVGDFRITPCDGAIPISEADRLAQEAVEQHNIAVAKAEREAIMEWLRKHGMRQTAMMLEKGEHLK
jgi:hypothetical protein